MISNEVDKYLADRLVNPLVKEFDVSQWWRVNSSAYPSLSKLAKDIFAIPCSTVASENAFSLGKRVVNPFRSSLTPQMVEALVCTSDWLRAEQPNLYAEQTKVTMSLYSELEELQRHCCVAFRSSELFYNNSNLNIDARNYWCCCVFVKLWKCYKEDYTSIFLLTARYYFEVM
ncbi:hypothetical protein ACLB2K_021515 [Fragaria x ananassa]